MDVMAGSRSTGMYLASILMVGVAVKIRGALVRVAVFCCFNERTWKIWILHGFPYSAGGFVQMLHDFCSRKVLFFCISEWKLDKLGGIRNLYSSIADRSQDTSLSAGFKQSQSSLIRKFQNTYLIFIINRNIDDSLNPKAAKLIRVWMAVV